MRLRQGTERSQVMLVTSSLPNEGKTTFTACLAQSAARSGERVLVIDCDSARRQYSATYVKDKPAAPGLREVLNGDVTIAAAIIHDEKTGVSTLPITRAFDKSDQPIDAAKMTALITQLREHFHLILLDTAPLLPVAETRELAGLADRIVLMARWRHTSIHALRSAIELLPPLVASRVGVVLSRIDMKKQSRFSKEGVGAFHSSYKGYYYA
jgi:Mrp family chromosome partitioning ATPase